MSHDVFRRSLVPRQGTLTALLLSEDTDRDAALNELLGIDRLDVAVEGVSRAARSFRQEVDALDEALEDVVRPLRDRAREAFDQRTEARQRALDSGASPPDMSLDGARSALAELAGHLDIEPPMIASRAQLPDTIDALDRQLQQHDRDATAHGRLQRLKGAKESVAASRSRWQEALKAHQRANKALAGAIEEHGRSEDVTAAITAAKQHEGDLETALAAASEQAATLTRAREWLDHQHDDADELPCPVCQRGLPGDELRAVIERTRENLEGEDGQLQDLRRQFSEARDRKRGLQTTLETLERLADEEKRARRTVLTRHREVNEALGEAISNLRAQESEHDSQQRVSRALEEVRKAWPASEDADDAEQQDEPLRRLLFDTLDHEISQADADAKADEERQLSAREQITKLRRIGETLEYHARLEALDDLLRTDELAAAQGVIAEARSQHRVLQEVASLVDGVAAEEAQAITADLAPLVDGWFRRLSRHHVLSRARLSSQVESAGRKRSIRHELRVADPEGDWLAAPGPEISGGYQMLLGIAVLLALAEHRATDEHLDLLALDELHGLDPDTERRVQGALGAASPAATTIVATVDDSRAEALVEAAGPARSQVLRFREWTSSEGTRLDG